MRPRRIAADADETTYIYVIRTVEATGARSNRRI
jgi:hypothetical protein